MKLLLQSHGSDWQRHDFTGKMPSHIRGEFSHGPSRLEVDVSTLKEALQEFKQGGSETGLSDTELAVLRWRGAKASLSSVMQHLNIPPVLSECKVLGKTRRTPWRTCIYELPKSLC